MANIRQEQWNIDVAVQGGHCQRSRRPRQNCRYSEKYILTVWCKKNWTFREMCNIKISISIFVSLNLLTEPTLQIDQLIKYVIHRINVERHFTNSNVPFLSSLSFFISTSLALIPPATSPPFLPCRTTRK